ncbi:hypothetical protein Tco_0942495 [Tanacetum coccineum]
MVEVVEVNLPTLPTPATWEEVRMEQPLQSTLTSSMEGIQPVDLIKGEESSSQMIEEYPLPEGLKMPSYVRSYDGKGDLDNYLHLFEGAILMQKWTMPVACHMFTYTLKDSAGYVRTGKKHVTRSLMEFLSIDLPTTYKGLMEKTYTWIKVKEAAKKRASSDHK